MKVTPKKHLGQHFLKNEQIAEKIVGAIQQSYQNVLEIGPGMGVLTHWLIQDKSRAFAVIEIDTESVEYLKKKYPDLHIIEGDFLKLNLDKLYSEPIIIIGNFPYNISSQILFKVLDHKEKVIELVGMFQKEVAERIASKPGKKSYGILSVLLQAFYDIDFLFIVDEDNFEPPPKVKSAVIRLKKNDDKYLRCNETLFREVVKTAFNQRRKTLRNSLKKFNFEEEYLRTSIFNLRPEQLDIAQFEEICLRIQTA